MKINNNLNINNDILKSDDSKKEVSGKSFSEIFKETVYEANNLKQEADNLTNSYISGETENLHEVMIAAQKAEIAISFVTEIRNRLMEAYQEFNRMQL